MEATKTAIKTNNNELALKMIENLQERPELWNEFLSIGILNKNYTFTKSLIEKLGIDLHKVLIMNPSLLHSEINKENSSLYSEVECPLIILAAMGGDIEIFKYFAQKVPNSLNLNGHIALSKKSKNSVLSNVVGAASFYSNLPLLEYILHQFKSNVNFRSTEKRVRSRNAFNKEWTDFPPSHLAVCGEGSEEDIIQILDLLNSNKADMTLTDTFKNNIVHLSCINNKVSVVKYLLNSLNLHQLLIQVNKEGHTPFAIAQDKGDSKLISLLQSYSNTEQSVEDEINKLIEETEIGKKKKAQKKKKGAKGKDEIESVLLNSTDYQETFKQPAVKKKLEFPAEEVKNINSVSSESPSEKAKEEAHPTLPSYSQNKLPSNGEKTDAGNNVNNYERRSYNTYKERDNYSSTYKNNKYYYDTYSDDYSYGYERYNRYTDENSTRYSNKDKNSYTENKTKKSSIDKAENQTQNILSQDAKLSTNSNPNSIDNQPIVKPNSGIIGLNTRNERKNKSKEFVAPVYLNIPIENEESDYEEDFIGGVNEDAQQEIKEEIVEQSTLKNKTEEINEDTSIRKERIIENPQQNETSHDETSHDEAINDMKDTKDINLPTLDQNEEKSIHNYQTSEQVPTAILSNLSLDNQHKESAAAYLELERKFELERMKTQSLEQLINTSKINSGSNSTSLETNQNIKDLLALANAELEEKCKMIKSLTSKIEYLEGRTVESLDDSGLNKLKDFYGSKLSTIVAAMTNKKYQNDVNNSSHSSYQGQ